MRLQGLFKLLLEPLRVLAISSTKWVQPSCAGESSSQRVVTLPKRTPVAGVRTVKYMRRLMRWLEPVEIPGEPRLLSFADAQMRRSGHPSPVIPASSLPKTQGFAGLSTQTIMEHLSQRISEIPGSQGVLCTCFHTTKENAMPLCVAMKYVVNEASCGVSMDNMELYAFQDRCEVFTSQTDSAISDTEKLTLSADLAGFVMMHFAVKYTLDHIEQFWQHIIRTTDPDPDDLESLTPEWRATFQDTLHLGLITLSTLIVITGEYDTVG